MPPTKKPPTSTTSKENPSAKTTLPTIFTTPLRPDVIKRAVLATQTNRTPTPRKKPHGRQTHHRRITRHRLRNRTCPTNQRWKRTSKIRTQHRWRKTATSTNLTKNNRQAHSQERIAACTAFSHRCNSVNKATVKSRGHAIDKCSTNSNDCNR